MPESVPPADVADEVERLTRLARDVVDEEEAEAYLAERASLLSEYDYTARVREDDDGDVLVLYPSEWVENGVVQPDRIEDVDRGIERRLDGAGDAEDWDDVDEHNRALVATVADRHGAVHAANVSAFADFMSNHYARPLDGATNDMVVEFLTEYYPRNAWPSPQEKAVVEESVALAFEAADEPVPTAVRR
ncbi:rnhA operon protein [Haloarculaceae archaeon H-GB2-1]|nr:rnhA operon protein [Haloarculaceae archaeon H-GB1-1]MEA5387718.1 rnhA operon protein [Haloarculaceae archaeon H-GB11]MEA5409209.1 rnhA operon protein [Haloarculaceae archaeon H-GB2-1]